MVKIELLLNHANYRTDTQELPKSIEIKG